MNQRSVSASCRVRCQTVTPCVAALSLVVTLLVLTSTVSFASRFLTAIARPYGKDPAPKTSVEAMEKPLAATQFFHKTRAQVEKEAGCPAIRLDGQKQQWDQYRIGGYIVHVRYGANDRTDRVMITLAKTHATVAMLPTIDDLKKISPPGPSAPPTAFR